MTRCLLLAFALLLPIDALAQPASPANPLWRETKIKNYLPHMTWPEVQDLRTRTDMVIIPIAALEQHALHLPIGTDFINGVERAKLIAQQADVLVAPILMPGNSPYHMEFAGTISLSSQTIQQVYFEAAQSLMQHGFKRFLLLNAHGGNQVITRYVADRINQETEGIAVDLGDAAAPFMTRTTRPSGDAQAAAKPAPDVVAGDPTATLVFLAEGLKAKSTGKGTSTREMSDTGTWGVRDPKDATAARGREDTERFVDAAIRFIARWRELRP
jgi:creatinine amidohydrolase